MQFNVAPLVNVNEIDLTAIVPQVSTTEGAIGGVFRWGPIGKRVLIDTEDALVKRFGKPSNLNPETWFTAASFLAYGNNLYVARAANTTGTSPLVTATTATGNSTVLGNTSALEIGMIVIASNNGNIKTKTTISAITNSTAFVVDSASQITANGASVVQFVSNNSVFNAFGNTAQVANLAAQTIKSEEDFIAKDGVFDPDILFIARYPGEIGNSLKVSVCDTAQGFTSSINLASYANGGANVYITVGSNTANVLFTYNHDGSSNSAAQTAVIAAATSFKGVFQETDLIQFGNVDIGTQSLKVTGVGATTSTGNGTVYNSQFTINFEDELRLIANQAVSTSLTRFWEFYDLVDQAPGQSPYVRANGNSSANDELHVIVVDEGGIHTGVPGTVLEAYRGVSRATDAKTLDNEPNYYKNRINDASQYIYVINDRSTALSNTALNLTSATNNEIQSVRLGYGQDGSDERVLSMGSLINAYDLFKDPEDFDVSIILQGKARGGTAGGQLANYIIDNICEKRKDCIVTVSPDKTDVVNNVGYEVDSIVEFRDTLRSTSYAFMDSGYKYSYDKYNDVYRYIPLNGDMAGLMVRTDLTNDAWWSPAGFNRGQVKNLVRLAWNPKRADMDALYKNGINSVAKFRNQGTILYGDKTLLAKPSAFDRINVRRLFIVLEKAIATATKFILFEFNDDFTRAQFRNLVVPYLRDVQGRRGIKEFLVVCDDSNNTGEVIDRNELIGDIYIKPARSINYITLNFVAVRTGTSFSEIIGQF